MILTITNNASGTRSYLNGLVTVNESSSTVLPRELNVVMASDSTFLSDLISRNVIIDDGSVVHGPSTAIELMKVLSQFSTDNLATLHLYYSALVNLYHNQSASSGTTFFTIKNHDSASLNAVIDSISLIISYDAATPLSGNTLRYEIVRFTGSPSGGTQITPVKFSSISSNSVVDVRSSITGLTTSGLTFESSSISVISCPAIKGVSIPYNNVIKIKLGAGEGLAIRALSSSVSGQGLFGNITWSLR